MATQASPTTPFLRALARRFAGQILLSGAVMLTLNAASRIDLGLGDVAWPGMADEASIDAARREAVVLPSFDLAGTMGEARGAVAVAAVVEAPAPVPAAPVLEARLPVPARLFADSQRQSVMAENLRLPVSLAAPAKRAEPIRTAAFEPARAEGVLLFDQCRPICETQDPLVRRRQADHSSAPVVSGRTRLAALEPAPAEIVGEAEIEGPVAPALHPPQAPAAGLLSRSLSTARDTTLAAAGSLARLVSW
ncbi:hypothetical protein [Aureimonas sp. AU20]|uniref:hypothetical protein n=1 Tax=Aureimonas sp. AU20 TaxID=1349819 RepID=UPI000721AEDC|nr:hypothetical protein [Aureimonas sp. AU20]ALN74411.1 hypothetical protein M673_16910 [Aureimonas sp. AU20]